MREQVIKAVLEGKIIAIVRGVDTDSVVKIAEALYEGGVNMVEVTFNQADPANFHKTADSIRALREAMGDKMLVGAGTVTSPELVQMAADAGALYIISPDTDIEVIKKTRELGLPYIFIMERSDGKVAQVVSAETGAQVLTLQSMQVKTSRDLSYVEFMRENLENLRKALQ